MPRLLLPAVAVTAALSLLSGCSAVDSTVQQPARSGETASSEPAPTFSAGGTAAENEKYFSYVLRQAIREGMEINGVNVVNELVAAGFEKGAMQVSFDTSRTGLVADNIFVSVRVSDQCLMGQIVTSDKTVSSDVQPAVGPDKSVCLIGETRPIDW